MPQELSAFFVEFLEAATCPKTFPMSSLADERHLSGTPRFRTCNPPRPTIDENTGLVPSA